MSTMDVYAGKDLGTLELTITDDMVQHYVKGLDEPNPWYTTASPFGGPVAPVIVYQQADSEFKGWYLYNLFGNEFFYRSRNYHNDKEASKGLGFENTVIGGRMTLSCVTELLTRHFGRGFYLGGRLDVKFTNVLWPNEPFTTRGIITGRRVEGGRTRADVTIFCEKADGTKIIVASASALEG